MTKLSKMTADIKSKTASKPAKKKAANKTVAKQSTHSPSGAISLAA